MGDNRKVLGKVSVERSGFGLAEEDPFLEAETEWMELEFTDDSPNVQVAQGQVHVLSAFRSHDATVTLELSDTPAGGIPGWSLLAQLPYLSRSGIVEVWTIAGPEEIRLDLQAEEAPFTLQVFRRHIPDTESRYQASLEVPHGLEEYVFRFSPAA
ncbi:hypothetical protein ACFC1R_21105 [Kitasatospora sp. NPDC056138]|uniref:hypothetical protein n=1 Tax=Kitasatospora sp. NPDC056138 TaxID=3345724 RepID=UPI0035D9023E